MTALQKLLSPFVPDLSGNWERCEGGMSEHPLYEECMQTKTANNNDWMSLLKFGVFLENSNAGQKGAVPKKKGCCYKFGFSCVKRSDDSTVFVLLLLFLILNH